MVVIKGVRVTDVDGGAAITTAVEYDRERGVLAIFDEYVRQEIEVRKRLEDAVLRQAVIIELEKLGYTVISPEMTS